MFTTAGLHMCVFVLTILFPAYIHTYIYTYRYIHTYIDAYIHTVHTYTTTIHHNMNGLECNTKYTQLKRVMTVFKYVEEEKGYVIKEII